MSKKSAHGCVSTMEQPPPGAVWHHLLLLRTRFGASRPLIQGPSSWAWTPTCSVGCVYCYADHRPVVIGRPQHGETTVRHRTVALGGVLAWAVGLGGCGGSDPQVMPLAPSPPPAPTLIPAPPANSSFPPGTLTGVSLSGVVYELTPTGRRPIPAAIVYCELCGQETHTFATADADGFYHFSGDLTKRGGVWVVPGVPILLAVGYNEAYKDPPGLPALRFGAGWREVLIDGDTRFDIELVRRLPATP
jgi:hypothetical protein